MATRFIKVKAYQRPVTNSRGVKLTCLHCRKGATITATRRQGKFRMPVRYCPDHAQMRGAIK
jgi:hypothetical protein